MRSLLAVMLLIPPAVLAATPPPDAGTILQQIKPSMPSAPPTGQPRLNIEPQGGAMLPPSAPFEVKTIRISGNTLFDTATLHALVADGEGKQLTLTQLDELAARITGYYHSHGYPLARAIIPAQTIRDGVLNIEVIEARYGKIKLDNSSRVYDPLLQDTLALLQSGQAISQQEMDQVLLLASDIPGVSVNAILKPGEAIGTSDLQVETSSTPAVIGRVSMDNFGNRYTGKARAAGSVSFINPLRHGDVLSAYVLSSGKGMSYGRASYESLLNGKGTRLGGSYSAVHYVLGDTLAALNGHGTAQVASLWAKHPLVRSRDTSLYGQFQYDRKQLRDRIDTSALRTDRHLGNSVLSLSGDLRDTLLSGGINIWSLGWTSGRVGFDDTSAQANDAATAKTQGRFSKWNANFSRLQGLTAANTLYFYVAGQWSNANLDSSEKMTVGGPYSVRAYDMGAASGDAGYQFTAEFRRDLGRALQGQWQAMVFVDSANVTVNKTPWVAGTNSATLRGAGLGLNWANVGHWSAKAYIASRLGSAPALVANASSTRAWIEISKGL